ncbi:MAG: molybdopterin-dependent oxidoreductase [Anaerolineae bacterium]
MNQRKWTRRRFLRVAALTALGGLAAACEPSQRATPSLEVVETPTLPHPTQSRERVLTNENRPAIKPNWNVRYFRRYIPIEHDQWRLTVEGLVEAPQSLSLGDLLAWPRVEQDTRMKCVECWSARASWAGFTYDALAEIVRPLPKAAWVYFECADGYYESLSIEELSQSRVLFAYEMDGEPLLDEFGAPLRLVVPPKYGYKGPKVITSLRFETEQKKGYWPTVGPYSADGTIQPGRDFPLDLGEAREIEGGEITDY